MVLTLEEIARQQREWSERNFPNNTPLEPLFGLLEEQGECAHAILKRKQGIRGTPEDHIAAERDAIGDMAIYLLDFARRTGTRLHPLPDYKDGSQDDSTEIFMALAFQVGSLANEFRSSSPRPHSYRVDFILRCLCRYSSCRGWDFMEILNETWAEVGKRDWVNNPIGKPEEVAS